MAHVISQKCITEVYAACQQVCPADCMEFVVQLPVGYPAAGQPMMVINGDECIDCGACEPECPVSAIFDESSLPADKKSWIAINAEKSPQCENITQKQEPLPTAEERKKELGL